MNHSSKIAIILLLLSLGTSFAGRGRRINARNANQTQRNTNIRDSQAPQAPDLRGITRQERIATQQNDANAVARQHHMILRAHTRADRDNALVLNQHNVQQNAQIINVPRNVFIRVGALPVPLNIEEAYLPRQDQPALMIQENAAEMHDILEHSIDDIIARTVYVFRMFRQYNARPNRTEQERANVALEMYQYIDQTLYQVSENGGEALIEGLESDDDVLMLVDVLRERSNRRQQQRREQQELAALLENGDDNDGADLGDIKPNYNGSAA